MSYISYVLQPYHQKSTADLPKKLFEHIFHMTLQLDINQYQDQLKTKISSTVIRIKAEVDSAALNH